MTTNKIDRSAFALDGYEVRTTADGRTLDVLAVPFDRPTNVGPYVETFKRGAFAKTITERPEKVKLLALHEERSLPLGAAKVLREDAEGLFASMRVSKTRAGDEALELIADGALDSVSIGFVPVRSEWSRDRTAVERREVKLLEISLVAYPAYDDAKVLALREQEMIPEPVTSTMSLASARRLAHSL